MFDLTVSKVNDDLFMVSNGHLSRRYIDLEQILNELYNGNETDLSEFLEQLEEIEKRIERIERFCNSLGFNRTPGGFQMIFYAVIWKDMHGEALGCVTEDYERARKKLKFVRPRHPEAVLVEIPIKGLIL